jgi:uncharacterized membrane protein
MTTVRDEAPPRTLQSTETLDQTPETTSRQPARPGVAAMVGGAALFAYALYRGTNSRAQGRARAHEQDGSEPHPADGELPIETCVTINHPHDELFAFWHRFENLPKFMKHLESVHETGDRRSHWVAKVPAGGPVEWDAEIVEEENGRMISWRSLPGSQVSNAGTVWFDDAPGGRGTIVRVQMEAEPSGGGAVAHALGKALEPLTTRQVHEDLRRFKNLMEAGEIPTNDGQPVGKRGAIDVRNPL